MKLLKWAFDKLALSSFEVVWGHPRSTIAKKGQISIFFKSRQILPQNEALELNFSQMVSRLSEVIRDQK